MKHNPHAPRRVIAVDLDEVLSRTTEAVAEFHNDTYGTSFTMQDFHSYDYSKVWGGTVDETIAKMRLFYDSKYFLKVEPVEGSLEALKLLKSRRFSLVIVTARQQFVADLTKKFVDRHFPGIFESIYFANHYLTTEERLSFISKPKSVICRDVHAQLLIDDSLENALEVAKAGIPVLLFDLKHRYPWNKIKQGGPGYQYNHTGGINQPPTSSQSSPSASASPSPPSSLSSSLSSTSTLNNSRMAGDEMLPSNVTRVTSWKEVQDWFPRPRSPLCMVLNREDFFGEEEDDSDDSDDSDESDDDIDRRHRVLDTDEEELESEQTYHELQLMEYEKDYPEEFMSDEDDEDDEDDTMDVDDEVLAYEAEEAGRGRARGKTAARRVELNENEEEEYDLEETRISMQES